MAEEDDKGMDPALLAVPRPFDVRNWYWRVNEDPERVFSSALATYVPIANVDFVAWQGQRPEASHPNRI